MKTTLLYTLYLLTNSMNVLIHCFNLNLKDFQTFSSQHETDNYFGYSVLLQNGKDASVVVGSPKSNSSIEYQRNITEPGTIFRCYIESNTCIEFITNGEDDMRRFRDHKSGNWLMPKLDGAFIGNSIAGGSNTENQIVVCGSRWIKEDQTAEEYFAIGICYLLKNPLNPKGDTQIFLPLIDRDNQGYNYEPVNEPSQALYYYAMGQFGMSIKYIESKEKLLIGAPGVMNWRGTCVTYKNISSVNLPASRRKRSSPRSSFQVERIPNPIFNSKLKREDNTYLGYDVGYGKFRNDSDTFWYVSGAPRGTKLYGQVLLFEMPDTNDKDLIHHSELVGDQMGAYFGSSLLVIDLNNDNADDLLVGAPLYSSNNYEEGCVYLYMNDGNGAMKDKTQFFGSSYKESRFGTSMSSLGDINGDNYPDVVISAPYEEDGRGVIYIYLSSGNGLKSPYSQKIEAQTLNANFRGFGFSLSKGVDVDENQYNDLAVGAYKSGHVILLKSQPVVKFHPQIESSLSKIAIEVQQLAVNYCLNITTKTKLDEFEAILDISVFYSGYDFRKLRTSNVKLSSNKPYHCSDIIVDIITGTDKTIPLKVQMNYKLKKTDCVKCPITDPDDSTVSFIEIPFANGCGPDNICQYNLKVDASFNPEINKLVIGKQNSLEIDINLSNVGDPSYLTKLTVSLPNRVELLKTPKQCGFNYSDLVCDMGNPLMENIPSNLKIEIDLKQLNNDDKELEFILSAFGSGLEMHPASNKKSLLLNLTPQVTIVIGGSSTPNQMIYRSENNTLFTSLKFSHAFTIQNLGPTHIKRFNIDFFLPKQIKKIGSKSSEMFTKIYEPTAYVDGQSITCQVEESITFDIETIKGGSYDGLNISKSTPIPRDQIETHRTTLLDMSWSNTIREKREAETAKFAALTSESVAADLPSNRTFYFNCSSQDFNIECMHVKCFSGQLKKINQRIDIKFEFAADFKTIEAFLVKKDILLYSTKSLVTINDKTTEQYVHTIMLGKRLDETVAWWIIILAILIAILLIALIVLGLWKFGFFKRELKEELLNAKQDEGNLSFVNPQTEEVELNG